MKINESLSNVGVEKLLYRSIIDNIYDIFKDYKGKPFTAITINHFKDKINKFMNDCDDRLLEMFGININFEFNIKDGNILVYFIPNNSWNTKNLNRWSFNGTNYIYAPYIQYVPIAEYKNSYNKEIK